MSTIATCILCDDPHRAQRAETGTLVCGRCSAALRTVLDHLGRAYAALSEVDELTPGGHPDGTGTRRPPGPRSPAVDALLVHTDPRSRRDGADGSPAALATVESWTRMVREELEGTTPPEHWRSLVPDGPVTMARELATLRFHWYWLTGQPWVDEFARDMREVLHALRAVRRELAPVVRLGACQVVFLSLPVPWAAGSTVDLYCGAPLRVRVGDTEIRCRGCGSVWTRDRWHLLASSWASYAELANLFGVPVGTLYYWAHEDGWRTVGSRSSRRVSRLDALSSLVARRPAAAGVA